MATSRTNTAPTPPPPGWLIVVFYGVILVPVMPHVGGFLLLPYRGFLLLSFFPTLYWWATGRAGRIISADICVLAFCLWSALSFFANHGFAEIYKIAGFTTLETAGAYFLGRTIVTNTARFMRLVQAHLVASVVILPLALLETQTGAPLVIDLLAPLVQTYPVITYEPRLGLERAQVVFQHPILMGVFCAMGFALFVKVLGGRRGWFGAALSALNTLASVSSGAFLMQVLQWVFLAYDTLLRRFRLRWMLFAGLGLAAYIFVDLASNRTPFHVFVSYLTLNPTTAYNRILIWEWGIQNVAEHPILGLGLHDWVRPKWMKPSVDNTWLLIMMRHGVVGFVLFAASLLIIAIGLAMRRLENPLARRQRAAVLLALPALIIGASTVHLWGAVYVWTLFFLGASVFLLDCNDTDAPPAPPRRGSRYTRFDPARHTRKS